MPEETPTDVPATPEPSTPERLLALAHTLDLTSEPPPRFDVPGPLNLQSDLTPRTHEPLSPEELQTIRTSLLEGFKALDWNLTWFHSIEVTSDNCAGSFQVEVVFNSTWPEQPKRLLVFTCQQLESFDDFLLRMVTTFQTTAPLEDASRNFASRLQASLHARGFQGATTMYQIEDLSVHFLIAWKGLKESFAVLKTDLEPLSLQGTLRRSVLFSSNQLFGILLKLTGSGVASDEVFMISPAFVEALSRFFPDVPNASRPAFERLLNDEDLV